jgi:hypothetical protein
MLKKNEHKKMPPETSGQSGLNLNHQFFCKHHESYFRNRPITFKRNAFV